MIEKSDAAYSSLVDLGGGWVGCLYETKREREMPQAATAGATQRRRSTEDVLVFVRIAPGAPLPEVAAAAGVKACDLEAVAAENVGLGGLGANKGGQLLALRLAGSTTLTFVSAHLNAHEGEAKRKRRNDDVAEILSGARAGKGGAATPVRACGSICSWAAAQVVRAVAVGRDLTQMGAHLTTTSPAANACCRPSHAKRRAE